MHSQFFTYDAYKERYQLFYSDPDTEKPNMLAPAQFTEQLQLLKDSYQVYDDLVQMGRIQQASTYFYSVVNHLENQLAIADASDNLNIQVVDPESLT
ncbi:hypothetical protein IC620_02315 [Hazenella sp. IB182357]|uniref:Uncharacterized protein n=1 Tax=Polycladospora coralii TaxID=2771432 RepID=A0A926RTD0_9BACL|nr:hypothetical protein [Polycladospora coralii]MBD1371192.1 hypothetical protein [Polycladospora coralii]MBS7530134.1 hypothetical protein [Polycladospora coralii]